MIFVASNSNEETHSGHSFSIISANEREERQERQENKELHDLIIHYNLIWFQFYKIEPIFIEILCIIQHEEERFQHSSLSDEGKEDSKGGTNEETYSKSETYYHATCHYGATIIRIIIGYIDIM